MKKTLPFGILIAVAGLFLGIFIAPVSSQDKQVNLAQETAAKMQRKYDHLIRFGNILDVIDQTYVDEPNIDEIMDEAIKAVVASLDPHSEYLPEKKYKELMEQTSGSFGGLGIRVQSVNGLVRVVKVLDDTPAMRAGLLDEDMITKIDDTEVLDITLNAAIDLMRGEVGSPIKVWVKRKGETEDLEFNLNREIIKLNPVTSEVKGEIGYITLSSFSELTEINMKKAIEALTEEIGADKIKGFILDLRGNGGGLLNQAFYTADLFIKEGEIASTRGRDESLTKRYNAETGDMTNGLSLVLLIDGDTASSSEIVSGALQDYERATLIGTRSFGKGSVQTIMPIGDNSSALRITTARYYTPSGRSIQAQGIIPDWIIKPIVPEGIQEIQIELESEATLEGHLTNEAIAGDEDQDLGSYSYVPRNQDFDIQLIYALKFLNGEVKLGENMPALEAKVKADIEAKWAEDEATIQAKIEEAKTQEETQEETLEEAQEEAQETKDSTEEADQADEVEATPKK